MRIEDWRAKVKATNPGISDVSLDSLVERELFFREANKWSKRGLKRHYIPYIRRKRRMEMFMELGVSLAEGFPELHDLLEKAEDIYAAEYPDYIRRLPCQKD